MAINIEDIMSEIRSDIQEKGLNSSMLSFADVPCDANPENPTDAYDPDTLRSNVQYVSTQYQMQPYRPLAGNPVMVFFKKVLRRLMRFYIEPLAQEQTYFNANTAQALQEMELHPTGIIKELHPMPICWLQKYLIKKEMVKWNI